MDTRVAFKFRDYFELYQQNGSIPKCVMELQKKLEESLLKKEEIQEIEQVLTDWNRVKACIYPTLCNTDWNKERLKGIPHREFMDLSITYYVRIDMPKMEKSTVVVNKNMLKLWKRNEEELYQTAMENQQKSFYLLKNIAEILRNYGLTEEVMSEGVPQMYVLTNEEQNYGLGEILNMKPLKELSGKLGCNLYLIPSSLHEFILLPDTEDIDTERINTMIQDVNQGILQKDEILSDHAYYYDREQLAITCMQEVK